MKSPSRRNMFFFSEDDKPEFQNIKEYCAVHPMKNK